MKNERTGTCRLCGKTTCLSFEHVPPKSAFNNTSKTMISGEEIIKHAGSRKRPWEISDIRGSIQQQGSGGYFLCQQCNNNTGAWYVPYYLEFVKGLCNTLTSEIIDNQEVVSIIMGEFRPLPVFKQILLMFLDINSYGLLNQELRNFLLSKNNTEAFNKQKYRVFCYFNKGPIERRVGICSQILHQPKGFQVLFLSEIATIPIGFSLFIDKPEDYIPKGCDITAFADFNYEDVATGTISIPILETNTWVANDFRNKKEIEAGMNLCE